MGKESFLLVSLKEEKAKKLAQVISNDSCRKILEHLAEKEATETELSETLNLPLSTVHYNLQHLVGAGLVAVEEFHYSEKGKEINHYKLSNKYVIIAPKSTFGLKEKLKSILPAALITAAAAGLIHLLTKSASLFGGMFKSSSVQSVTEEASRLIAPPLADAANAAPKAMLETASASQTASAAANATQTIVNETIRTITQTTTIQPAIPIALWFLIGAISALLLYLLWNIFITKKE